MNRREFITLLSGGAASWPLAAAAQLSNEMRSIGILMGYTGDDAETQGRIEVFREALRGLGWMEGRNMRLLIHAADADPMRRPAYAAELVRQAPEVILANTVPVTAALKAATSTIPIVFAGGGDPVAAGLVSSLSRPGGNITGFSATEPSLAGKWLELLIEAAPDTRRVAIFHDPANPLRSHYLEAIHSANAKRRLDLATEIDTHGDEQVMHALREVHQTEQSAILVLPGAAISVHRRSIIAGAAQYRLPAVYPFRYFVAEGGLLAYGSNNFDLFRRAASYVDRILRGETPGELPIQVPTKFDLTVNLKTAKALGLTVPPTLLARADEVIE